MKRLLLAAAFFFGCATVFFLVEMDTDEGMHHMIANPWAAIGFVGTFLGTTALCAIQGARSAAFQDALTDKERASRYAQQRAREQQRRETTRAKYGLPPIAGSALRERYARGEISLAQLEDEASREVGREGV